MAARRRRVRRTERCHVWYEAVHCITWPSRVWASMAVRTCALVMVQTREAANSQGPPSYLFVGVLMRESVHLVKGVAESA